MSATRPKSYDPKSGRLCWKCRQPTDIAGAACPDCRRAIGAALDANAEARRRLRDGYSEAVHRHRDDREQQRGDDPAER